MGIANICSSMIGGLTIIPGIIKSTTCIVSGGRTAWVNFYNAIFLIIFLLFAGSIIKMIPIATLVRSLRTSAISCRCAQMARHVQIGIGDLAIFAVTYLCDANFRPINWHTSAGMNIGTLHSGFLHEKVWARRQLAGKVSNHKNRDGKRCHGHLPLPEPSTVSIH